MRFLMPAILLLMTVNSASAEAVDDHINRVIVLTEERCRAEEASYRQAYLGNDQKIVSTISLLAEGTRLLCESVRLQSEQTRLAGEEKRLRSEAARLEKLWLSEHSLAPDRVLDFPGRDQSQNELLVDAATIGQTKTVLAGVVSDLRNEARRILLLASDEFDILNETQAELVLASLDGEDEYDILERLLKHVS